MKKTVRAGVSVIVGIGVFIVVGAGVTELLSQRIWLSAIVGLPLGIIAGVFSGVVAYGLLKYRETGSRDTLVNTESFVAGVLGFVAVGGAAVVVSGMPMVSAMVFIGAPIGLIGGVLVGYVTHRYLS
ncbi:MAG: hypothetical protein SV253_05815 [Halobacteria archaeon]|nr:hypothetical protein [Halobacteria archaeon]